MAKTCGATTELPGGEVLTCGLKPGIKNHPENVHDDNGHKWGDMELVHDTITPDVLTD